MDKNQVHGIHGTIEALKTEQAIDKIFIQKSINSPAVKEITSMANKKNITIAYVPIEKLNRLTKGNHQGVVATISPIEFSTLDTEVSAAFEKETTPLFIILDQITDVRNFGAIIRTAECCNVSAIIIQSKGGAPVNGDTIKTSAGAVFNVPIIKVDHVKDAIYYMQSSGVKVVAATEKTNDNLYQVDLTEAVAIVMGNEEKGVSESVLKIVDQKAKLPMYGTISSLNVSVACGAFLYEVVRQRL